MDEKIVNKITKPLRRFLHWDAAAGLLLIVATVAALLLANSPWANFYHDFWQTPVSFTIGEEGFSKPLLLWVNDGLMAVFFFLIGLEIKREILDGELSSLRKATFPLFAAIGGMVVPIALFFLLNTDPAGREAWGIPMATDIAFSLGVLSLLGARAPIGLIIFLTAFAIVDDIGAILVITLFYAHEINWTPLFTAGGLLVFLLACNLLLNIRRNWIYIVIGIGVWYYIFKSGLHPTIAGVMVALIIPARNRIKSNKFLSRLRRFIQEIKDEETDLELSPPFYRDRELNELYDLKRNIKGVVPPVQRLEYRLEEFVSYFILPVFALANAGVSLSGGFEMITRDFTLSIATALLLGKVFGVLSFSWISVQLGIAALPVNTRWPHIAGAGLLGGIGFTMAIFISNLALEDADMLAQAKLGILLASLVAGISGYWLLRQTLPQEDQN